MKISGLTIFASLILHLFSVSQDYTLNKKGVSIMSPDPYSAKYALIIGNYSYKNGWNNLPHVHSEIHSVDSALKLLGFKNTLVENLAYTDLVAVFNDFIQKYDNDVNGLLVYYSGHGYTLNLPKNQFSGNIVPVDAPFPNTSADYSGKLFSMIELNQLFRNVKAYHSIFIFNTCFSGSGFIETDIKNCNIKTNIKKPVKQLIIAGSEYDSLRNFTAFASAFISGLSGKADQFKDNMMTGSEMARYISGQLGNSYYSFNPKLGIISSDSSAYGDFVLCKIRYLNDTMPENFRNGELQVKANFDGMLSLDGILFQELKKNTELKLTDVSDGLHHVSIDGIYKWDTTISITAGATSFLKVTKKHKDIFDMVFVVGGGFQMGSYNQLGFETPIHRVFLDDYYIGKYEVTQKQWRDIMGNDHVALSYRGCDSCPVENVNYNDVQNFISKLNIKTGMKYRLPTEAEWEYAAIGGLKQKTPENYKYSGSNKLSEVAWYSANTKNKHVQPVGGKYPNILGIYDMTGNVWEWCSDYFSTSYYKTSDGLRNPECSESKEPNHVLRGGGWTTDDPNVIRV
ncbi:MAG: SUMF1/EgtB/PvdO family nonheme iron enzyme, partial [Bacteroidales bacterium]